MAFPQPLRPCPSRFDQPRKTRTKELFFASLRACSIRSLLILIELIGYATTKSQALLLDAIASGYDLITSMTLILCLWLAQSPPDREHPYGHGRIEPIAGMQLALFLTLLGGALLYEESRSLLFLSSQTLYESPLKAQSALFSLAAALMMELSYRHLSRYAKKHESRAMSAEALHYRLDAANSLLATFALALGALLPGQSHLLDHLGAFLIALLMVISGLRAAKKNLDQLLDRRPEPQLFARIEEAASQVEGVLETEKIAIQHYGPDAHVDIDIEVDPSLRVDTAHEIAQKVRVKIQESWPMVRDVTVHVEPFYTDDH